MRSSAAPHATCPRRLGDDQRGFCLDGPGMIGLTGPTVNVSLDGREALVDAYGCDAAALRSLPVLEALFERAVRELDLHPVGDPRWHVFPDQGGITGLLLLAESHLTCHTYPEREFATFNLYCCRPREDWPWQERLGESLKAERVVVRCLTRGEP